jgi:hypothetical protein
MELQRRPQMPMSTLFSKNGRSPKRDWGAIEPKAKRAPKGGGPFLGGRGFPSRPTLGLAKPTLEGDQLGMAQGFGLAAHLPLLRRSPLRDWLCLSDRAAKLGADRRRGRAPKGKQSVPSSSASGTRERSPSLLINNFFSFGAAQPSPKAPPLP